LLLFELQTTLSRRRIAEAWAECPQSSRHLEAERLVFIDETWTRTDMAPLRCGRARKNAADSAFWPLVCLPRYSKFGELG
jgi:hypothetical protein